MSGVKSTATLEARDNVEVSVFDVNSIKESHPDWTDLDREEKINLLEESEPVERTTQANVLTLPYREHLARLLLPTEDEVPIEVPYMALGDDSTATDLTDTELGNEVMRIEVDEHIDRGAEVGTVTLLGSDDGVGLNLVEAGLVSTGDASNADDTTVNRVLLEDPNDRLQPKTTDHAVTVKIDIKFQDKSEVAV